MLKFLICFMALAIRTITRLKAGYDTSFSGFLPYSSLFFLIFERRLILDMPRICEAFVLLPSV